MAVVLWEDAFTRSPARATDDRRTSLRGRDASGGRARALCRNVRGAADQAGGKDESPHLLGLVYLDAVTHSTKVAYGT
jgi:hypothetical protein